MNNFYFKDPRYKTRAWTFIVYPDSAPSDWRDIIDDLHIPWVESPLHDRDQNPMGDQKKPHWHVLIYSDGPKTFNNVSKLIGIGFLMIETLLSSSNPTFTTTFSFPNDKIINELPSGLGLST